MREVHSELAGSPYASLRLPHCSVLNNTRSMIKNPDRAEKIKAEASRAATGRTRQRLVFEKRINLSNPQG